MFIRVARSGFSCQPSGMMGVVPERCGPDDPRLPAILALIRIGFAGMEGRIDPPSSMHNLTVEHIAEQARSGEVWVCGSEPVACVFLTEKPACLYLSKLTVALAYRGTGFARRLVDLAETRAQALGLCKIELQSRVELTENHAAFAKLGFVVTAETRHPGYCRTTSLTMQKDVSDG
ncbi:MAG: GNAT family N-acetyltransferase [Pseudomonadota bacterium]